MCRTVLPTKQNYTLSSFASWLTANPGIITLLPGPFVKGCVCVCGGGCVSVCKSNRCCCASVSRSTVLIRHPPASPPPLHIVHPTHLCQCMCTYMHATCDQYTHVYTYAQLPIPYNTHAHAYTPHWSSGLSWRRESRGR